MKDQTAAKGMGLRHKPGDVSYTNTLVHAELAQGAEDRRRSKELEIFQLEQLGTSCTLIKLKCPSTTRKLLKGKLALLGHLVGGTCLVASTHPHSCSTDPAGTARLLPLNEVAGFLGALVRK